MLIGFTMPRTSPLDENPAPQIPGAIERPRLLERLESATQYRLILISAPAGFGKTTLASQFARETNYPLAWHTVEERERDIPNLYEHSLAALEKIAPGIRQALPEPGNHSPAELATLVAEYLWGALTRDAFYIVDDVHHLTGFPAAETWLQHLVSRLPRACHLVLLSRTLPTLPFAELIARNEVLALSHEELRLTDDEIARLAHRLLDDRLTTAEVAQLVSRLDGWPAGIMLALQPLPPGLGNGLFSAGPEPEALFEALASSMLQAQLPDLRHFLLESATLTRLTPELCSTVLGIPNSANWLNAARTQNLFLTRVPGGLVYHTLFRDFLQKHLRETNAKRFAELHERAARWFEERDDIEQAFDHYLEASRVDSALNIAESAAVSLFSQGKHETLLRWNERLRAAPAVAPRLAHACATIHADRLEYQAAEFELERAEVGFSANGDAEGIASAHLQRARIHLLRGENLRAEAEARQLTTSNSVEVAGRALRVVGLAQIRLGEIEKGIQSLEEAVTCYRSANLVSALSHLLQDLQYAYTRAGQLDKAGSCLQEVVALRRKLGGAAGLAQALNNLGYYYHQQNNYHQALSTLQEALDTVAGIATRHIESYLLWSLGDLKRDLCLCEQAEQHYARALSLLPAGADPNLRCAILVSLAALRRREGRPDESRLVAQEALSIAERANSALEQVMARAVLATVDAEQGEPAQALEELELVAEELAEQGARFELVGVLGLCASVSLLNSEPERAEQHLQAALAVADDIGTAQPLAVEMLQTPALEGVIGRLPPNEQLQRALAQLRAMRAELTLGTPATGEDDPQLGPTYSLRVLTLGREEVLRDGTLIASSEWRAAAAREMFLYLLFFGPKSRGEISLVFWPDSSAEQVRANFHTTLHRARQALGPNVIVYERDSYFINPEIEVWCDALELERMNRQARLLPPYDVRAEDLRRKAAALYQGEFLLSLDFEWVYQRRDALNEVYLDVLVGLGQCAKARRDFQAAIDHYTRALVADPYREEIHREIMSCYGEMGERGLVLHHLEEMISLFRRELGVEPTDESIQFARSLLK